MQPPHGQAPVYLHDLLHKLQTGFGTRPRPTADGSESLTPMPVEVQLLANDAHGRSHLLTLDATEWALYPFMPTEHDPDTGKVTRPEQRGRLVLCAVLPAPFLIHDPADPAVTELVTATEVDTPALTPSSTIPLADTSEGAAVRATRAANGLPETTDPAVTAVNPTAPAGHTDRRDKMGADLDGKKD